jgi:hypothetical protein
VSSSCLLCCFSIFFSDAALNLQQRHQQHQTLQPTAIDSVAATATPNLQEDDYEEDVLLVPIVAAAKALEDDRYDTFVSNYEK